ncbi:MAG: hypothetical protein JSU57_05030 [Candidatus Heimdallarchaeota archaeon]|nr:MAG: hypothetical protein JSU57_05030 [Candidatus Heimdallarchaeota archaeon]
MNNTEFRTSTSIASEINRLVRQLENLRTIASDFYEELQTHASYFKASTNRSDDTYEKKRRFKRIGVLLEELKEHYWDITDLLMDLNGIEILTSDLLEQGTQLSRDLVLALKEMDPIVRNAYKSLRSSELVGNDLHTVVENRKFSELNEVLDKLVVEIKHRSSQLEDLRQKRIL